MLYYLFYYLLRPRFSPFNVFRYITVRTTVASLTALFLSLALWSMGDRPAAAVGAGETVHSRRGPKDPSEKSGNAHDGGVLIRRVDRGADAALGGLWRNAYVILAVCATLAFGAIGFPWTITIKWCARRNLGLTARGKFLLQVLVCFGVGGGARWLTAQRDSIQPS